MAITLRLKDFNGPLDMLLHMIGKEKIDIQDIFVSEITDQYIHFVNEAEDLDMEEASSFIQMAATLLEIKSRSLLPKPPQPQDEEDPQTILIRQLHEYARFKQIAADMQGFEKAALLMYQKLPEEYPLAPPSFEISGLTMRGLLIAFANVSSRRPKQEPETSVDMAQRIMREEHSVHDCMLQIIKRLKENSHHFSDFLREKPTKEEIVTFFLALLELLRLGRITISQDETYGEILICPVSRRKNK